MTGVQTVQAIVEILVSALSGMATGLGGGIKDLVTSLFYDTPVGGTTGLSTFAILVVTFAAIALAIGLSKRMFSFLTSFGKA